MSRKIPPITEQEIYEAEQRWIAINNRARAAGCKCGKPATKMRSVGGNVGSIPVEFYYCDEHINVINWDSQDGGKTWTPSKNSSTPSWFIHSTLVSVNPSAPADAGGSGPTSTSTTHE